MTDRLELLHAFESDQLDPAAFTHPQHVDVAAALLARAPFLEAAQRYQGGIVKLATRAGAPNKANLTITLAFLSIIAERLQQTPAAEDLWVAHPDLLDRALLGRWYSPERLAAPGARRAFLMPDHGG